MKRIIYFALSVMLLTSFMASCSDRTGTASLTVQSSSSGAVSSSSGFLSSSPGVQSSSILSSAASLTASAPPTTPEEDALYGDAYGYYDTDKYDKAINICDQVIAQDADCYWAYNIKGIALYFANGNSYADKALTLIKKSVEIYPDYYYGYFNEALIYKGLKQYDTSLDCFNKVIALKPDDTWSYYGISTIYADTDNLDGTLEYLKKAIDLDPTVKDQARTEDHFIKYHSNAQFKALMN